MKKIIILLELGLFLISISLLSQSYLIINKDYCLVTNNTYLIVQGYVNNQSIGNLYLTDNNSNVRIQNNITNDGNINSSGIIELYGNWINNSTCTHNNTSNVYLKGANQTIEGSATTTFYNLYLQGTGVKTLLNNEFVNGTLYLQDRELATQNYTMTVNNSAVDAIQRNTGFVSSTIGGGLARATNSDSAYLFPVGVSGKYRPAEITPTSAEPSTYKVRMANDDAINEGYDRNIKATDVCEVNPSFFHIMQQTSGSTNKAKIKVYYDNIADGSWDKVGYWNGSLWNNYTGSSTSIGSPLYYGSANDVSLSSSTPIALTKKTPVLTVNANPNPTCSGQSTTLTASGADNYSWSTGDSTASITVTPSSTTIYSVTGTLLNGCSSTASITVTVNPLPTVTASANPDSLCLGNSSILTANSTISGTTYSWSSTLGIGSPKTVTPTSTTTYTVTGTTGEGCTSTATVSVTVNPLPTLTATANLSAICLGDSSNVMVSSGIPGTTFNWSNGLGTNPSVTVNPTAMTTYSVTGTTPEGCTGTAEVTVTVHNLPNIDFSVNPAHCGQSDGSIITNVTSGIPPYIYQWSNGANSPNLNNISADNYNLTVSDNNGCSSSISITLTEAPMPQADFTPTPQITTIEDPIIYFENYSIGASFCQWDFGDGNISTYYSPTHTYEYPGTYYVVLTVSDQYGCIDTVGANIVINDRTNIFLPNAFTPNGNDLNELFNIAGTKINPNTFELRIFDRWGKQLFYTTDINQAWDGTYNGEPLPQGSYTYIIKFEDSQGYKKELIFGEVIIVK